MHLWIFQFYGHSIFPHFRFRGQRKLLKALAQIEDQTEPEERKSSKKPLRATKPVSDMHRDSKSSMLASLPSENKVDLEVIMRSFQQILVLWTINDNDILQNSNQLCYPSHFLKPDWMQSWHDCGVNDLQITGRCFKFHSWVNHCVEVYLGWIFTLGLDKVSMLTYAYTNPWGRFKCPSAMTRLTAHVTCGLQAEKRMVMLDTECP